MGFAGAGKGQHLIDHGAHFAAHKQRDDAMGEHACREESLLEGSAGEDRAPDRGALAHERVEIDVGVCAGERAHNDDAPPGATQATSSAT